MSYTKTDPQPAGLNPGETAVTLDDGNLVAVSADIDPQSNNAPSVIRATARAIHADGSGALDSKGDPVLSIFHHAPNAEVANDATQFAAAKKDCLLIVLGEPPLTILTDPIHANALANASIRNRMAALATAGPVDAGALL